MDDPCAVLLWMPATASLVTSSLQHGAGPWALLTKAPSQVQGCPGHLAACPMLRPQTLCTFWECLEGRTPPEPRVGPLPFLRLRVSMYAELGGRGVDVSSQWQAESGGGVH